MDPFVQCLVEVICFSFFLSLVCSDDDFEKWRLRHTRPRLPSGMIFMIVAVLMVAASLVILCCYLIRRQHSMQYTSPHIPPPLAATVSPVTSGARMQSSQGAHSLVPGAAQSPAASLSQPPYYQQPAVPYPQGLPYMGNNTAPLVQPSVTLYPSPSAPFGPPPPYVPPPAYIEVDPLKPISDSRK
uniref:Putative secreted peptide n=1 Tax=Rhipicephalus pulchellus TaxID=72859 RepID=L7LY98_RHIPC